MADTPPPPPGAFTFGSAPAVAAGEPAPIDWGGGAAPPPAPGAFNFASAADGDDDDEDGDGDEGEELPECVMKRLMALKSLHEKRDEINDAYRQERIALETKYNTQFKAVYEDRKDIVTGEKDVITEGEEPSAGADEIKGIPNFWLSAIGHHELLSELVQEKDVDALEHLLDVECVDKEDQTGFELRFTFSENEYFTNTVLTKAYEIPNMLDAEEPILNGVTGIEIEWNSGKSLTFKEVKKKQKAKSGKKAGAVRVVTTQEPTESFFNWFTPPELPNDDEEEKDEDDEDDDVMEKFDSDYQVALAFRNQIIGKALLWYTGEAAEDSDDEGDDDEGDDDDEDEDDDEDDEDTNSIPRIDKLKLKN